ncbi:MAG: SPOR domain-containing protein [Spirochaetales bacterium]|jgi:DedD protein|nr:SPOR domain-containing protein [Spirochaetales bacterium]
MDQKKILWIILSISLLLVVVMGIGLIWLRPVETMAGGGDGSLAAGRSSEGNFDAIELIREQEGFPGLEPGAESRGEDFVAVEGEGLFIGENPAAQESPAAPAPETSTVVVAAIPAPRPVQPAPVRPSPPPQAAPAPQAPRTPAPTPPRTPENIKEFWIQAAAFESNSRANEVKEQLTEKGFAPVISTRTVEGKTYFRVRLGPYPNQAEAAKFLDWIKALEGFSAAWITEVTVSR